MKGQVIRPLPQSLDQVYEVLSHNLIDVVIVAVVYLGVP